MHQSRKLTFSNQVPLINIGANKRQVIQVIAKCLNSMEIPSDEKVIMTGSAMLNDETNVMVAFHMIQEATARFSPIQIISDKTGIMLIFCPLPAPS